MYDFFNQFGLNSLIALIMASTFSMGVSIGKSHPLITEKFGKSFMSCISTLVLPALPPAFFADLFH